MRLESKLDPLRRARGRLCDRRTKSGPNRYQIKKLTPKRIRIYVSQLDTSRGLYFRCGGEDVYHCGAGDRVWGVCKCIVWLNLLDNNIILRDGFCCPFLYCFRI